MMKMMLQAPDLSPKALRLWLQGQAEQPAGHQDFSDYAQQTCHCGRRARGHPQRDTGRRYCTRCFWKVVREFQAYNRERGLCACGREKDRGYETCTLCRERKRLRMRRYRGKKHLESWDRKRRPGPGQKTAADPSAWLFRFLDILEENRGMIAPAARQMGVSRQAVYQAMHADPDFKFLVDDVRFDASLRRMAAKLKSRRRRRQSVRWPSVKL